MTPAEIAVLRVLRPGAARTLREIQQASTLTPWRTRNAISHLTSRGLITPAPGNRHRITPRGRAALATKAARFA
ncbi:MarR family transcriptional regulator [Nocardia inohanensis]|uniref:MarR family transcriptional regulator n=1 Tax=Nocardia inohanensis TaxID=209246 RepID=UPI000829FDD9|nr:MarR family transcriptional regulator [Nocardia inohanensis]